MTLLLSACIWVIAATIVAMLPMRMQYVPGIILLGLAPLIILWIALSVAWWAGLLALAAFVSMFRNPLRYFYAKARGQNPSLPPELKK